jgi:hypothetical protein
MSSFCFFALVYTLNQGSAKAEHLGRFSAQMMPRYGIAPGPKKTFRPRPSKIVAQTQAKKSGPAPEKFALFFLSIWPLYVRIVQSSI